MSASEGAAKGAVRSPCVKCGSKRVVLISYGLMEPGTIERRPTMAMGGCCVYEDSPAWFCHNCRHRWGSLSEVPSFWERDENLTELPPI